MTWIWLTALVSPLVALTIDVLGQVRASGRRLAWAGRHSTGARGRQRVIAVHAEVAPCTDYTVVVPIYGNIRYLENTAWLSQYGNRVLLATSASETDEFYAALTAIADEHDFRVFVGTEAVGHVAGKRSTGGTLRDTIVRDAHSVIRSTYVVCIDADTETTESVDVLVGAFAASGRDVGSVPLGVSNPDTVLGRLQRIEYAMAMRLRRVMPWMVSGGCHVARREVHAELMARHSLFFQGNDVELGLLALGSGYTVGHLDFLVPTAVPDTLRSWWRQRLAWAGGEFRIMVVNIRLGLRHPWLWCYGLVITFLMAPVRLWWLPRSGWVLVAVLVCYTVAAAVINRAVRDPVVLLYPFYALLYSTVLVPLGLVTYLQMAVRSRNAGVIRPRREPSSA